MAGRHTLPHVLIFELPNRVDDAVIGLHICEELLIVETAAHCAVEPMDARILRLHLLSGQ